jgi:hypothetical protein
MGFIYENGTDYMSWYLYLAPPVSLPGMASSPPVPLGGIPVGPWSVPLAGHSLRASFIYGLGWGVPRVSLWGVPCMPLSLKTLLLWDLIVWIQREYLVCTFATGFVWSPLALP